MEKTIQQIDARIENSLHVQTKKSIEMAEKSVLFETGLRDCLTRNKAINLRQFLREEFDNINLFAVPALTFLSPDFVIDRYFMSALTVSLFLRNNSLHYLVYANLTNFACFEDFTYFSGNIDHLKNKETTHFAWFIETEKSVFFPLFNMIINKQLFYKMMGVEVFNKFSSLELNQSLVYQKLGLNTFAKCNQTSIDFDTVLQSIEKIICECSLDLFKIIGQANHRIKEIEMLIYNFLSNDRKQLSKVVYNIKSRQSLFKHLPSVSAKVDSDFVELIKIILQNE